MSKIYFRSESPMHFLVDSKGDLYEVSEELAKRHADLHPSSKAVVERIDEKTNTIYFTSPLPESVHKEN